MTWLMPIVTCSDTVSWARAACGVPVGRYMLTPGSSTTVCTSPSLAWTSQTLLPWVWNTKTSWLSECTANPCAPGGVR